MTFRGPLLAGHFFTTWATISFSRRTIRIWPTSFHYTFINNTHVVLAQPICYVLLIYVSWKLAGRNVMVHCRCTIWEAVRRQPGLLLRGISMLSACVRHTYYVLEWFTTELTRSKPREMTVAWPTRGRSESVNLCADGPHDVTYTMVVCFLMKEMPPPLPPSDTKWLKHLSSFAAVELTLPNYNVSRHRDVTLRVASTPSKLQSSPNCEEPSGGLELFVWGIFILKKNTGAI
jgi:hypothetical protein